MFQCTIVKAKKAMKTQISNQFKDVRPISDNLPYQLNTAFHSSDDFYSQLQIFSNKVCTEGAIIFDETIKLYRCSSVFMNNEFKQSFNENLLDLLILGVLWNENKGRWGKNIYSNARLFKQINTIRKTQPALKSFVDGMKGRIGERLLDLPINDSTEVSFDNFQKLSLWLSCTNEYNEEVLRIDNWLKYLDSIPDSATQNILSKVVAFAAWFKYMAAEALGVYTSGVNLFLLNHKEKYAKREDFFFTGRKEVDYHLNMVGAAIMNSSMQKEFLETNHKVLLLPSCMSKNNDCKSMDIMTGRVCTHCTPSCNISIVSKEVREQGIFTYIISHSSNFSESIKRWANQDQIGLIGTACTLNLLMGGFEMKRLNIPSQCVFLDYSGCKKHWDEKGIPTNLNIKQIKRLVKVESRANQAV